MSIRSGGRPALAVLLVFLAAAWAPAQTAPSGNWADRAASDYETMANVPYRTASNKELEALTSLVSPDATILIPGKSRLAGMYSGRDAMFGFLGSMKAATDGDYRAQLLALYSSDNQAVAIHHGTGTRPVSVSTSNR